MTSQLVGTLFVATTTGIGTTLAREATERLLGLGEFDHVMVVGIAGGMGASKVGDVIFPEVVVDKAQNITTTTTTDVDGEKTVATQRVDQENNTIINTNNQVSSPLLDGGQFFRLKLP